MKFNKFIIHSYRGISEKIEIDISKDTLIPIIGKNESGKTTFLEAILSFDNGNDDEHGGRHLKNIENLYSTDGLPVEVEAVIEIPKKFNWAIFFKEQLQLYEVGYKEYFEDVKKVNFLKVDLSFEGSEEDDDFRFDNWQYVRAYQILVQSEADNIHIIRNIETKKYSCDLLKELSDEINNDICESIVLELPYVLYFDDFRDRLPNKIYITEDSENNLYTPWINYIEELFHETKSTYSVFTLASINEKIRKSIIKEVQKVLNQKLIKEWSNYQFENTENIEVQIEYVPQETPYLQLSIEEKISIDDEIHEKYFDISDRSKGFYWYVNFMIKLHYNPKKRDDSDKDTVYLLDEPGSYLHTFALSKLAEQLKKLSIRNKVIYCTHSHYLLNPDVIPINSIRLAEKNNGKISLKRIDHKKVSRPPKNSPYQAIFDALEVRPPLLEFDNDKVVLLEGIYDFYCFKMFTKNLVAYFPCVSASSIINQIPYMIFLGKSYIALWDNDGEGRGKLKKAIEHFGEYEAKNFMTLGSIGDEKDRTLEDLFDKEELLLYTEQKIVQKELIKKIILDIYYSKDRQKMISQNFAKTKNNFEEIEKLLIKRISKR